MADLDNKLYITRKYNLLNIQTIEYKTNFIALQIGLNICNVTIKVDVATGCFTTLLGLCLTGLYNNKEYANDFEISKTIMSNINITKEISKYFYTIKYH